MLTVSNWQQRGDDPVGHVLSLNLHRRHLTASQLAMVGTESLPHYEAEARKRRQTNGGDRKSETAIVPPAIDKAEAREKAAAAVGVSPRYVSDAKRVKAESPELAEKVKAGEITLPKAITPRQTSPDAAAARGVGGVLSTRQTKRASG